MPNGHQDPERLERLRRAVSARRLERLRSVAGRTRAGLAEARERIFGPEPPQAAPVTREELQFFPESERAREAVAEREARVAAVGRRPRPQPTTQERIAALSRPEPAVSTAVVPAPRREPPTISPVGRGEAVAQRREVARQEALERELEERPLGVGPTRRQVITARETLKIPAQTAGAALGGAVAGPAGFVGGAAAVGGLERLFTTPHQRELIELAREDFPRVGPFEAPYLLGGLAAFPMILPTSRAVGRSLILKARTTPGLGPRAARRMEEIGRAFSRGATLPRGIEGGLGRTVAEEVAVGLPLDVATATADLAAGRPLDAATNLLLGPTIGGTLGTAIRAGPTVARTVARRHEELRRLITGRPLGGEPRSQVFNVTDVSGERIELPGIVDAGSREPADLRVAIELEDPQSGERLRFVGEPGEIHADVLNRMPEDLASIARANEMDAALNARTMGFVDEQTDRFLSREEAARAIGSEEELSGEELAELEFDWVLGRREPPGRPATEPVPQQAPFELGPEPTVSTAGLDRPGEPRRRVKVPERYRKLSDDDLQARRIREIGNLARAQAEEIERMAGGSGVRIFETHGGETGIMGTGRGAFARGRQTQAKNRLRQLNAEAERRGLPEPDEDVVSIETARAWLEDEGIDIERATLDELATAQREMENRLRQDQGDGQAALMWTALDARMAQLEGPQVREQGELFGPTPENRQGELFTPREGTAESRNLEQQTRDARQRLERLEEFERRGAATAEQQEEINELRSFLSRDRPIGEEELRGRIRAEDLRRLKEEPYSFTPDDVDAFMRGEMPELSADELRSAFGDNAERVVGELEEAFGARQLDLFAEPAAPPRPQVASAEERAARVRGPRMRGGGIDLRGQVIDTAEKAAEAIWPFRNPRYEQFHVLYMDEAGKVLAHHQYSAGAIDYVGVGNRLLAVSPTRTEVGGAIPDAIRRTGATQFMLAHNHPSGDPRPSPADRMISRDIRDKIESAMPEVTFWGHLVIDDTEAYLIPRIPSDALGGGDVRITRDPTPGDWLDAQGDPAVSTPRDAADYLLGQTDRDHFHVLYLSSQNRPVALERHPIELARRDQQRGGPAGGRARAAGRRGPEARRDWLSQRKRGLGSAAVIVGSHPDNYVTLVQAYGRRGDVRDVLSVSERTDFEGRVKPDYRSALDENRLHQPAAVGEETRATRAVREMSPEERARRLRALGYEREALASEALPDVVTPAIDAHLGPGAGEAPRRSKIVADLADALKLPIRTGFRQPRNALGIYKVQPEVIRTRVANDIEVAAHEVGHHMQRVFFGVDPKKGRIPSKPIEPWGDEMRALGAEIGAKRKIRLTEGFAEFWRRYLTNPDAAREKAPRFYAYAEGRLLTEFPEIHAALREARQSYAVWLEAGPQARVRAAQAVEDDPRYFLRANPLQRFYTNVVDDLAPIERMVKDLLGGKPEQIELDAPLLARLTRGAPGQGDAFVRYGTLDFATLDRRGPSLIEHLSPVAERLDDFRDYAIARRAVRDLHPRGIETGIRDVDARAVLQQLESPEFERAFEGIQQWGRELLEYLRDSGVISEESVTRILEANPNWVPFYRAHPGKRQRKTAGFGQFGHLFNPVKRIKGSGLEIVDPLESLVKNAYLYTHLAARAQVQRALGRLSIVHGAGRWIERIESPVEVTKVNFQNVIDWLQGRLDAQGVSPETAKALTAELNRVVEEAPEIAEDLMMVYRPGDFFGKENIISILQPDGTRQWYEVQKDLYAALTGLDRETAPALVRYLSYPARFLRAGATTFSPEFPIRNVARDAVHGFVVSEYGFKPGIDTARGLFHLLNQDELYWKWKATGGEWAALVDMDRKALREGLQRAIRGGGLRNVVKNPLQALQVLSAFMENATRMGEFARGAAVEAGESGGFAAGIGRLVEGRIPEAGKAGFQRAGGAAREVSVDFARHGAKTAAIRMLAAFWNARIQGYDRLFRAFKEHPVRTSARTFTGITLPSILLYYVNRDDPDYWELPQWERDLFWHVKVGGTGCGTEGEGCYFVRIPKPFELGIVAGSIPQRILEWVDGEDPEGLRGTLDDTLRRELNTTVLPIPTFAQPLIDNYANRSMFLQRPLVPRRLEGVAPEEQLTETTSDVAVLLGRMLKMSPIKIDNTLRSYTGGGGRLLSDLASATMERVGLEVERPERVGRRMTGLRTPGLRGFISEVPGLGSSESETRFYDRYNEASRAIETLRHFERTDRPERAEEWREAHAEELDAYRPLRKAADALAQVRARMRQVGRDPQMSDDEKEAELRRLRAEKIRIAREALGEPTSRLDRLREVVGGGV